MVVLQQHARLGNYIINIIRISFVENFNYDNFENRFIFQSCEMRIMYSFIFYEHKQNVNSLENLGVMQSKKLHFYICPDPSNIVILPIHPFSRQTRGIKVDKFLLYFFIEFNSWRKKRFWRLACLDSTNVCYIFLFYKLYRTVRVHRHTHTCIPLSDWLIPKSFSITTLPFNSPWNTVP